MMLPIVLQGLLLLHIVALVVLPEVEGVEVPIAGLAALLVSFPGMGRHPCGLAEVAAEVAEGLRLRLEYSGLGPLANTTCVGSEVRGIDVVHM